MFIEIERLFGQMTRKRFIGPFKLIKLKHNSEEVVVFSVFQYVFALGNSDFSFEQQKFNRDQASLERYSSRYLYIQKSIIAIWFIHKILGLKFS